MLTMRQSTATVRYALALAMSLAPLACQKVKPFSAGHVDQSIAGPTKLPLAVDPARVGTFPGSTKSGAGYFYDEVLEYRVWLHPERGARRLAGDDDYFAAFARYETALDFSSRTAGAEEPLVLIRQLEHIDEPTPGTFIWIRVERLTEWQVRWLEGSHREPDSIPDFLQKHGIK
jgi:hypothetical protein